MAMEQGWILMISIVLNGETININMGPQADCTATANQWLDAAFAWEARNHIDVSPAYMCIERDPPRLWRAHR